MTREEAKEILTHNWTRVDNPNYSESELDEAFFMAIEALQADAVHGEWKIDEYGIYHCPFCHAINNTVYKSFCPNCGARMKGGAE